MGTLTPAATPIGLEQTTEIVKDAEILMESSEELPKLIKQMSVAYGLDSRLTLAIAKCESQLRHYRSDGEILRGRKNPQDIGVFQINEKYHLEKSRELNFDIHTPAGNIEYAMWLMDNQGERPWRWSKKCWG